MSDRPVSPRFIAHLGRALDHWRARTETVDDLNLPQLARDLPSIEQVLEYGLGLESTLPLAAEIIYQCFPIVERQGVATRWMPLVRRALPGLPAGDLRLRLHNHLGTLLHLDRRLTEAVATHRQVEQEARALGNAVVLAHVRLNLGYDHLYLHQYETAAAYAAQAAELQQTDGLPDDYGAILANLNGLIRLETGQHAAAYDHFAQAAELLQVQGRLLYAARALINMARAAEAQAQFEHALTLYDRADELLQRLDNKIDRQLVALNRGTLYSRIPRPEQALAAYLAVDELYLRQIGHTYYLAMRATNIGDVSLRLERPALAERYLRQAVALWREMEDTLMLANAVGTLGEALLRQDDRPAARTRLRAALDLLRAHQENAWGRRLQRTFSALLAQIDPAAPLPGASDAAA